MLAKSLAEKPIESDEPRIVSGKRGLLTVLGIGLSLLILSAWKLKVTGQPPFLHRENVWSVTIYEGISPLKLKPTSDANLPKLTAEDVTDMDALFVADPFMVQQDDKWFLFVEVLNRDSGQGDLAVATSQDEGATWQYQSVVLDEPWHLSYPSVFRWDGKWYLLPQGDNGVRLYEAETFPTKWKFVSTLLPGPDLADPTLFRHNGGWWMFVGKSGTHDRLQLFYADELRGTWTEHPCSPIIEGDPDIARPGGKVVTWNEQLYRFAQDCSPKYGNQLRAFKITELSRTGYEEEPIDGEFVLTAGSHDWNKNGMHHVDAHQLPDGSWRAAVDGHKKTWIFSWKP